LWPPHGRIVFDRNDQIRIVDADGSNDEQFVA
jgi:hypothetical protein